MLIDVVKCLVSELSGRRLLNDKLTLLGSYDAIFLAYGRPMSPTNLSHYLRFLDLALLRTLPPLFIPCMGLPWPRNSDGSC